MAKSGKKPKKKTSAKKVSASAKKEKAKKEEEKEGIRGIVRLAGKDISGYLKLERALMQIKGISHSLKKPVAMLIQRELGIAKDTLVGTLTDEQIEQIDNLLFNLDDSKLPAFLLNNRRDIYDGTNRHYIMNDLDLVVRRNIERKKRIWNWQGERHIKGKKVRGQRTKNTGRRGLTVGVVRKKK